MHASVRRALRAPKNIKIRKTARLSKNAFALIPSPMHIAAQTKTIPTALHATRLRIAKLTKHPKEKPIIAAHATQTGNWDVTMKTEKSFVSISFPTANIAA